jgi:ethanolamine utilization microcompartment shell protein EutL
MMEPDLNQERQQAHALLDMLSADKLNAVRSLLEVMVEPLERSLAAALVDEEEITPETAESLEQARASLARAEGIPHE